MYLDDKNYFEFAIGSICMQLALGKSKTMIFENFGKNLIE